MNHPVYFFNHTAFLRSGISILFLLFPFFGLYAQSNDSIHIAHKIDSLLNLSFEQEDNSDIDQAISFIDQAKALAFTDLGKKSYPYIKTCYFKARLLHLRSNIRESGTLYAEVLNAFEEGLYQKDHLYLKTASNLAALYFNNEEFKKSEPFLPKVSEYWSSREIQSKEDAFLFTVTTTNITDYMIKFGEYDKAEPILKENIQIRLKYWGENDIYYLWSSKKLADLYSVMGRFFEAESYYNRIFAACETNDEDFGKDDVYHIDAIHASGDMYKTFGQLKKADEQYSKALGLIEQFPYRKKRNSDILISLARLYMDAGQLQDAEQMLTKAKSLLDEHNSENTKSNYLVCNMELGRINTLFGRYQQAEDFFSKARQLLKDLYQEEDYVHYAGYYFHTADFHTKTSNPAKAEDHYSKAIAIQRDLLGKQHPDYLNSLRAYSALLVALGKHKEAYPLRLEIGAIQRNQLSLAAQYLNEYELNQYTDLYSKDLDTDLSYLSNTYSDELIENVFDNLLFKKGYLLNASMRVKNLALSNPEFESRYHKLQDYRRHLANTLSSPDSDKKLAQLLSGKADSLEKELVRNVSGYGNAINQYSWKDLKTVLRPGEAAIEFVRFNGYDSLATGRIRYAALLLRYDDQQPHFISLFEEDQLKPTIDKHFEDPNSYIDKLYVSASRGAFSTEGQGKSLFTMLWQPVDSMLQNIQTVYYAPSGIIHRLALDAVQVNDTLHLSDRFHLIRLGSLRALLENNTSGPYTKNAILYGGIEYELDTAKIKSDVLAQPDSSTVLSASSELIHDLVNRGMGKTYWRKLAYSKEEVDRIKSKLETQGYSVQLRSSHTATEESFQQIGKNSLSPQILHIATHGYFFPDPRDSLVRFGTSESIFKTTDHPLIRSGIILAGANHAWQGKEPIKGIEDGILTAYDISQMNLENTELVVLSACDTGLGDIEGNEGVYGLQRAFKIAGVKYIIMSLWEVPDKQTRTFMSKFYKHWIEQQMSIPDAFRATQREVRNMDWEPVGWAGFVLFE